MPAVSKKQQRFFGMVRAAQKGEMKNPSKEVSDVANDISNKDAKKFAKTKHKGLPEVKEGTSIIKGNTSSKKVSYRGPTADNKRDKDGNIVASHYGKREDTRTDAQKKKHSDAVRKFDNYQKLKDKVTAKDKERKKHNQEYHASKKKENDEKSVRNNQRPTFKRIKEATTMKDNNLFGNAYAGDKDWKKKNKKAMAHRYKTLHKGDAGGDVNEANEYEKLKKKIGSKKKHDKPAICEGISYKDFMSNVQKGIN